MTNKIKLKYKNWLYFIWGAIVFCSILLFNKESNIQPMEASLSFQNLKSEKVLTKEEQIINLLTKNQKEIDFYANMFEIDKQILINKITQDYKLFLNKDFDKTLIQYLETLEEQEENIFKQDIVKNIKSKDYMLGLISYFTKIYDNVDFNIAASIAMVESGYSSKYMLNKNNVFGGMYQGKLIQYKNIEYGIYKYIKILSEGYFAKGMDTIEKIGIIYNPTLDNNGNKVAKPSWVYNVNHCLEDFKKYNIIDKVGELVLFE